MRHEIFDCHYCHVPLSKDEDRPEGFEYPTKDHVVARGRGGLDIWWNIVWACNDCNHSKADSYSTCVCVFCKRTRRRHWERFGIRDGHGHRKGRNSRRSTVS